jgi:hypothetical protein
MAVSAQQLTDEEWREPQDATLADAEDSIAAFEEMTMRTGRQGKSFPPIDELTRGRKQRSLAKALNTREITGSVIAQFTDWMICWPSHVPSVLHQSIEEIPMVLRMREPAGGFEVMSESQQGTGHE